MCLAPCSLDLHRWKNRDDRPGEQSDLKSSWCGQSGRSRRAVSRRMDTGCRPLGNQSLSAAAGNITENRVLIRDKSRLTGITLRCGD